MSLQIVKSFKNSTDQPLVITLNLDNSSYYDFAWAVETACKDDFSKWNNTESNETLTKTFIIIIKNKEKWKEVACVNSINYFCQVPNGRTRLLVKSNNIPTTDSVKYLNNLTIN